MTTRKPAATAAPRRKKAAAASAPAYFLSLTIENVRCFGSPAQTLDLSDGAGRPAQWTIILGDNGVGKTTLLRSIAVLVPYDSPIYVSGELIPMVGPRYFTLLKAGYEWKPLRKNVREKSALLSSVFFVGAGLACRLKGRLLLNASVSISNATFNVDESGYEQIGEVTCFAYGAARRMSETSLGDNVQFSDPHVSPHVSLFLENVALMNAEEWLLRADYAASKSSAEIQQYARKRRDQIKEVLINLLPDIEDIRFGEVSKEHLKASVEFKTPYGWVRLKELSLGYKTLVGWMVDFASRMFDRYPDSPNPLAEPAVCLVDEIDLHLHPTWQRKLTGVLTELFPNTQFIVTAHSPLIVQAAMNANIVVLRREGDHVVIDNSVESLAGWSVDQILTSDLYGLVSNRAPKYDEAIAERQRLLSKPELNAKDKRRLQTLEAEVDELPVGDTAQESKAFDLVRRFAADLESKGVTRESLAQVGTAEAGNKQSTKKTSVKKPGAKKTGVKRTRRA